jgi:hypothetical protein
MTSWRTTDRAKVPSLYLAVLNLFFSFVNFLYFINKRSTFVIFCSMCQKWYCTDSYVFLGRRQFQLSLSFVIIYLLFRIRDGLDPPGQVRISHCDMNWDNRLLLALANFASRGTYFGLTELDSCILTTSLYGTNKKFCRMRIDTKDIPCKGGKVHVNVHTLRRKRRSCLCYVKLEVQKIIDFYVKLSSSSCTVSLSSSLNPDPFTFTLGSTHWSKVLMKESIGYDRLSTIWLSTEFSFNCHCIRKIP